MRADYLNNFSKKYKKALVTGGAGFIGSHIVEELLGLGLKVISVDNYISGKKENLSALRNNKNLTEINCDITKHKELKRYYPGIDIVFHNAASKKTVCLGDPRRDLEVNAKGTFNVLELARDFRVKKVIHASTGSVYGEAKYFPQDENHPLNPTSYYGVSKLAGEKYAKAFSHLYGMDISIIRYFHVYGPRQEYSDTGGVIPIFIRRLFDNQPPIIFGDGEQQRSFTYVKDVVRTNLLVAFDDSTVGKEYNCASGLKITINQLTDKLRIMMSKEYLKPIYRDWQIGDIKVFDVDNSNIKKLGFDFETSFDDGLKETIEWLRSILMRESEGCDV